MTKAPELNKADMLDVFLRELRGADRVVVETKNALGEYDAYYLHGPTILEAWNTRADLSPSPEAFQQMREALECLLGNATAPHADFTAGVCMCGEDMENHSDPLSCGHSPTDAGWYYADGAISAARAALKAAEGE